MTASMQPAMASQMMTSKTSSHQGDFSNVAPLTSPLPAGRVNAAITRMLNGARLASALWAEKSVPPRRRSGGGADAHAHLTPGVQAIVGASRRGTSGLAVGTSPRDRLLQRYAERSYPTLEDAGVPGSASPRGVSMRRKSELTSRRLQAYLVDEVADDLREELGLLPPGGVVDSGQFGLRPGGRGLTGSGGGGGQWRKGKALSMSDLSQSRADSLTHNHHSHTQEDIPITIVNGNLTKAASTNDPERLNHKGRSGSGGMDTPERASSFLKTPGGKGSGGGVGGVGEGRTRRRRGEGPGNRSVTNNNKASSSQPTLPPPPPLSETPPPGEQPPPPPPPQTPARLPSQPQDQIVTPLISPRPPNTRDFHITPVSSQEETSSHRLRTRPSTSPDGVAKISSAHVNFGTMDDDVLSRCSSYGSNRRRPPPTIAPPPPPDKATEGSTMAPSDWRASSPQTQRMPISGSLSRTAEMIRDRRIPPMPSGPPPPPPTAVSDDRLMVVGDPEGEVDEIPGQPEDNLIPVEEPEQVDLDVIPDGINRKHLPMLRDKRVFEKQLAARLERRLESEDQLLGDLRQCMELPTMRQKVETTMQVITDVIRTSIVADRAAGRRVYSVLVDLGNFHRHVTHHVDGHVVSVEGTTFGDPDTALTKELLIEFPESVVMEQLKVRQVGPTIELDVPFKPSEFMTDLTRVVNKMDADAEEGKGEENRKRKETNMAADDDGVGSVMSDQTLSVLSDPNDLGDPDDLHLPDLPISPPPPTPSGKEPKPMRRRRKFTKTGSSKQTESPSSPMSNGNALHTDISHAKASIGKSLQTGKSNSTMSNGNNIHTGSSHSSSSHTSSSHSSITNGIGTSFNKDTGYEAFRKSLVESQTSDSVTNDKTESSNSIDSLYGSDDMDFVEENRPHHKATYHSVRPNPFEADVKTESKVEMDEDFVTIRHVPFEKKASHSEIQKGKLTEQKLPHTQPNTSTFTQSIKGVEITDPVQVATVMDGQPLDNDSKPTSSRVTSITLQSSLQPTKPSHQTHRSRKIKVRKMSNPDYESVITVSNERVNSETDHTKMDRRKSDSPQHAIVDDWISIDCDDKDVSYDEGHSRGRLDEVGSNISSNTYSVSEYTIDEGESGISVQTRNDEEDMSEGGLVFEESLSPSASQGNSSTRIDKAVTPKPVFTPEPVNILTVTAVTGDQLSQSVKDVTVTIEEDRDEPLGSSSPNVLTHPNPPRHGLVEKSNNMEKCDPAVLSDQANISETGNQSVTDSKLGNLQPGPTELACDFESHQVHSSSDKMYQNVKGIQHKSVTTIDTNQANQGNHSEPTVSGLNTSHTKINHTRSNYREADIKIDDTPVKELKHSEAATTAEGMSKQSEIKITVEPDTPKAAIHEEEHLAPSEMGQHEEHERYNIQDNTGNTSDGDQDSTPAIYVRPKRPKDKNHRLGEGRDKESKGKEIEETKEDASESVYVRPKRPNKNKSESLHLEPLHLEEVEVYVRPKRSNREGKKSELSLTPDTSDHSEYGRHRKGRQDGLSERECSHVKDSTDIEPHVGKGNQESLTERGIRAITDSRFRRSNLDGANPQNIKERSVHVTTPGMVKKEGLGKVQVHSLNTSDTSHVESENRDGKRTLSQSKSQRDDSRIKVNQNEGKSPEWGRVLRRHPVDRRVDKAGQKPWDRQKRLSLDGRKSANMDKELSDKKPGGLTKAELIGEDERVGKLRQMFENLGQGKKSVQSNTGLRKVKVKPSKSDERTPVDNQTPIYV